MLVYAKKVQSSHPFFQGRVIIRRPDGTVNGIPMPDNATPCDGCIQDVREGYLIYRGKRALKADRPFDYYCESCLKKYYKGAIIMEVNNA